MIRAIDIKLKNVTAKFILAGVFLCSAGPLAGAFFGPDMAGLARADDVTPFVGYWEIDPGDCRAPQGKKQGAYLVISNQQDDLEVAGDATALMVSGDYGQDGGTCKLNAPARSGEKVTFDAQCQEGDRAFQPTRITLSKVYDARHLAVSDARSNNVYFYSLCNRNPDTWFAEQVSARADGQEEEAPDAGRREFSWLPRAWCSKLYARQSDFVSSGECAKTVSACMGGDGDKADCPAFARCEYWTNGRLRSSGSCGFSAKTGTDATDYYWIWRNGNIVSVHHDKTQDRFRWANREAETIQDDDKSCFELPQTGEKFCTYPYRRAGL